MGAEDGMGPPGRQQIDDIQRVIMLQMDVASVEQAEGLVQSGEPEQVPDHEHLSRSKHGDPGGHLEGEG